MMKELAIQRHDLVVVDGDQLFCGGQPDIDGSLCDDMVEGSLMRPDGSHVDVERFGTRVATQIFDMAGLSNTTEP